MEKIQIKNLKSITDSGIIDIKPITVFVGQNSSGKSSLIRCFPLFKQSAESKILGTVLWSGKYVDYGSFDESLNYDAQNSEQKEISFSFTYHTPKNSVRHYFLEGTPVKVTIDVSGDEYKKNSYTNITYEIHGSSISMRITTDLKIVSAYINGNDFTKQITEIYRAFKSYSIIPILYSNARSISQATTPYSALAKEIKTHVHHRTSEEKIHRISQALRFADDDSIKRNLTNKAFVGDHAAAKILNWSTEDIAFKNIRDLIILSNLERIIDEVSEQLISHFLATKYITPLRAAADRYYRVQNTSIDELDPNGSNLAMFLRAKSELEIQEMNAWLVNEICFSIDISGSHGHASIFVLDHVSRIRTNIADTGFGVSQILPVLVQIWQYSKVQAYRLRKSIVPITIIIEQPELHLHPKMQSRVGETFCKAIKMAENIGLQLRIIVETHSKDIIDSIGRCVENGIIKTESTAIYLINKEKKFNISRAYFDAGGFLLNWPYGFFDGA